jgi:DNA repair exonuclease SbcCD ATPase subunit
MKTNKVVSLIIVGIMLMPSTMVYAKGNDQAHGKSAQAKQQVTQVQTTQSNSTEVTHGKGNSQAQNSSANSVGVSKKEEAQANRDNKKQEIAAFKSQIKSLHTQMTALRQQIIPLQKEVGQKKEQLQTILQQLESGEKTLPADILNTLITESQKLVGDGKDLKATSGVTSDATESENNLKGGKFGNAVTSLNNVIAKFQARLTALKQLNADLDAMLAIANQATTPAPTESTQPNTSTGDTTTTQPIDSAATQPVDGTTTSTTSN